MTHTFAKQAFLDELRRHNAANLELVQTTFAPLDQSARSAQPEPDEWCVDQCLQHLVLSFDMHLTHILPVLEREEGIDSTETFTRSWLARRSFYRKQFDPKTKTKTRPQVTPSDHFYPEVFKQFGAQKARLFTMLDQAGSADLQQRCWFLGIAPINLGDFLEMFVLHDTLHIDQAQRALAAYQQRSAP
jgi:hypothetical protein